MLLPEVTPADVAAYAPDAPVVTADQVQEARDWAEGVLENTSLTIIPDSRQERAVKRAISAYSVAVALGGASTGAVLQQDRVSKLKDGAEEITFAATDAEAIQGLGDYWIQKAWEHLRLLGIMPKRRAFAGVSR